ncbi:hypothetical protein C8Q79DRAFT_939273 [Trametes meyenii]|nr:hypothetical protein C8Q79DRAFT_939273 [Trametes meyenii]
MSYPPLMLHALVVHLRLPHTTSDGTKAVPSLTSRRSHWPTTSKVRSSLTCGTCLPALSSSAAQPMVGHAHRDNASSAFEQARPSFADPTSAIPPPSHHARTEYSGEVNTQWFQDAFESSCTLGADSPPLSSVGGGAIRHASAYSALSGALGDNPPTMRPHIQMSSQPPAPVNQNRLNSATSSLQPGGPNQRSPSSPSLPPPSAGSSTEFRSSTRRNAFVPSTGTPAAITTTPPDPANRWQCPYCPYVQRVHRKPDLARHIATHTRPADPAAALWVCCGVPASSPAAAAAGLRDAEPFVYEGMSMVGGCKRTFSRRDALKRHLDYWEGVCFGDEFAPYLPGNREGARSRP